MDVAEERAGGTKIAAGKKNEAIEGKIGGAAIWPLTAAGGFCGGLVLIGGLNPFERETDVGKEKEGVNSTK